MKYAAFVLTAICACISVWFVSILKPNSIGAFLVFAAWLVSPHVVLTLIRGFSRGHSSTDVHWFVVVTIVCVGGILILSSVMFWQKDAQGALAVLMVPIFQGGALAGLLPLAKWLSRNERT